MTGSDATEPTTGTPDEARRRGRRVISRRDALALGAAGVASGVVLLGGRASGASRDNHDHAGGGGSRAGASSGGGATTTSTLPLVDPPVGGPLQEPSELRSADGVLAATLTAAVSSTVINGRTVTDAMTYNGVWPAPTMRVRPGDTFRIKLASQITDPTNLHWHGFHVSPKRNGDNVFVTVDTDETFDYEVQVPEDHPGGLYWYHPHLHGFTDPQVYGGLAGAIVVEGGYTDLPELAGVPHHLMMLKDIGLNPDQTQVVAQGDMTAADVQLFTVNGQVNPRLDARPGETRLWRVGNISNQAFFQLSLEGHEMHVVAIDGTPLPEVMTIDSFLLVPGSRIEFLVKAAGPGRYKLRTAGYNLDFPGGNYPPATLATLDVAGEPVADAPLPKALLPLVDLRDVGIDRKRRLVFSVKAKKDGPPDFLIDHEVFNHDRIDQRVRLNAVEEWKLVNRDTSPHPFHIHQNDFQVVAVNGRAVDTRYHNDTIAIPAQGSVTIRQRYTDFTGKWVYHCHILFHEDHGMMGTVLCRR